MLIEATYWSLTTTKPLQAWVKLKVRGNLEQRALEDLDRLAA